MLNDTLERLKQKVESLESQHPQWSKETSSLVDELHKEILSLSPQHNEAAATIAHYAHGSIKEASRQEPDPTMKEHTLSGLQKSISEFEATHSDLVKVVNDLCTRLSQMGI